MDKSVQLKDASNNPGRSAVWATAAAVVGVAAMAFAGGARADSNVFWSVGVNAAPGITVGVSNAYPAYSQPYYPQPVYVQPAPVYVQPRPVYVQPRPIYVQPAPVYVQPAPVYRSGWEPRGRAHGWHRKHDHRAQGYGYQQGGYIAPQAYSQPQYRGSIGYQSGGYHGR
ncbi:MAG: hypothetical protein V4731_14865 [Pseudomonadota bacterium]